MVRIIADFQPFARDQKITVYSDGNIIEEVKVTIDSVTNSLKGLRNKYEAAEIDLIGNSGYLSKFQKELNSDFSSTKVNIIQR